jgi:signal transduction histidine kinase/DNA-binding response OmpR family regulator
MAYVGFGAMAALIAVLGWLLYRAAHDSRDSMRWSDHTLDVLGHIAEISDSFSRAESANRGHLLYGTERFLGERDRALKQAQHELARIREMTADDAKQRGRVAALGELLGGLEASLAASAEDSGSEQWNEVIYEMEAHEYRVLDARRARQEENHSLEFTLLEVLAALILVMLVPAYVGFLRASRATRRAESRMRDLAESLPGAVFQFRKPPKGPGQYVFLSRNTAAVRGVDPAELLANPDILEGTVDEHDRAGLAAAILVSEETMTPLSYDFRITDRSGALRWIRGSAAPQRAPDASIVWTGHWGDVTEQKRLEQELRESKEAADAASRSKSTFLATMSHEIRTPMNGVVGMLELLSLTRLDEEQHTTLGIVRESGRSLLRIIDDILDFSRIEAGKLELRPEPTRLASVVERVVNIYAGNASSKGLAFKRGVDPRLDVPVMVDPLRLQQILNNFVSNAIKFTSAGEVALHAEFIARRDGEEHVRFVVRDTGIGISPGEQARLFQPFSQASEETTARYGGSGLGLSICRRLAELMGGTVEMQSAVGMGTSMVVNLALPRVEATMQAAETPSAAEKPVIRRDAPSVAQAEAEGTLILLVDDHPINRMVLLKQLNVLGYAAVAAEDGREALALWSHGRFGCVVTDCNMPEMNGYVLARRIRDAEAGHPGQRIPIIACTANALGGEAQHCFEAGMDDYLAKPVELARLAEKLERWLPHATAPWREVAWPSAPLPAGDGAPIDAAILDEISDGDADLAREVLARFHLHNDEDVATLLDGVRRVDAQAVVFAAHRIKGSSNTVGATALAEVCARLERSGHANDWTAIAATMAALEREIARLDAYLGSGPKPTTSPGG